MGPLNSSQSGSLTCNGIRVLVRDRGLHHGLESLCGKVLYRRSSARVLRGSQAASRRPRRAIKVAPAAEPSDMVSGHWQVRIDSMLLRNLDSDEILIP